LRSTPPIAPGPVDYWQLPLMIDFRNEVRERFQKIVARKQAEPA
jgi:hypothetical protein